MSVPLASPTVRAAIGDLMVAAEQLQLMLTRAAVVRHPLHPALERIAVGALGAASRGLLAAATFVAQDTARVRREVN